MKRARFRFGRGLAVVVGSFISSPASAHGHTAIEGMNDVISGALHPLSVPAHVLILLSLALFSAQRSSRRSLTAVWAFAAACALALLLTASGLVTRVPEPILCGVALLVAAMVALRTPLPLAASRVLFGISAVAIGLDSAIEKGSPLNVWKTLLGTWIGATILLVCAGYYLAACPRRPWVKIGIRILASWIVAIAVLMIAFSLRKVGT